MTKNTTNFQLSDLVGGTAWASLVPGLQRALGDQEPQVDQEDDDVDGVCGEHDDETKDQGRSWL